MSSTITSTGMDAPTVDMDLPIGVPVPEHATLSGARAPSPMRRLLGGKRARKRARSARSPKR